MGVKFFLQILPAAILLLGAVLALGLAVAALFGLLRARRKKRPGWGKFWVIALAQFLLFFGACAGGLVLVGFSAGFSSPAVPEWSDGSAPELEPLLRKHCAKFVAEGRTLGLAAAVVREDKACLMAFGRPSLASSQEVTGETLFEIGSITKTFTAILLASEIARGRLRLDQPVQELLSREVRLPSGAGVVTLRHLTTHTSGFPRLAGSKPENLRGVLAMLLIGSDPFENFFEADLQRSLRSVSLEFPPGQRMSYSNFGATTLGYALARSAGRDYEEMVKTELCRPLQMDETAVNLSPSQQRNFATGYRELLKWGPAVFGLRSKPWLDTRNLEGAGGLRSTGADMLRYLRANMRPDGSFLGSAIRTSHQPLFTVDKRRDVAMGWMISKKKRLSSPLVWHNGGTGGFRSFIGFTADGRCGVLVLSNSPEPVEALALAMLVESASEPSDN